MNAGELHLDVANEVLLINNREVPLRPKPMQLLLVLMQHPQSLVTKEQLLEEVWSGLVVTDAVLTTAMKELRQALDDNARSPVYIETVHRRGYRFLLPVSDKEVPESSDDNDGSQTPGTKTALLPVTMVLVLLAGYFWWSWTQDKHEVDGAFATLVVAEDTREQIASLSPELLDLLTSQFSSHGLLSSASSNSTFSVTLAPITTPDSRHLQISVSRSENTDSFFSIRYDLTDNALADAERIAMLYSQVLRCVESVRSGADTPFTSSAVVTSQLFQLCSLMGQTKDRREMAVASERIWQTVENDPTALALHAAVLSVTSSQYLFGQRDDETRRLHNEAKALIDSATSVKPDSELLDIARALQHHPDSSRWEREQILRQAPNNGWLGALVTARRAQLMRETGRLAESSRLYRSVLAQWPGMLDVYPPLVLVEASMGVYERAMQLLVDALALNPGDLGLEILKGSLQMFYGPAEDALDVVNGPQSMLPAKLKRCAGFLINARQVGFAHPTLIDEASCDEFDVTRQARIRAMLGDTDGALKALEALDVGATSITVVFFYPEFAPLFGTHRFWLTLDKFGLVEYWRESNSLPDVCQRSERVEFCREQISAVES